MVHNGGAINSLYLQKAGTKARATEENDGELIPLDAEYFDNSIRNMKKLVTSIYSKLQKKYGNDED